jgi:hypothetical protein
MSPNRHGALEYFLSNLDGAAAARLHPSGTGASFEE